MTLNKKIITILLLVMVVGTISVTYAATTFIGEDCTIYDPEMGVGKTCNDLNELNDRVINLESEIEEIKSFSFASRTSQTDILEIPAQSTNGVTVLCPDGTYITNVGYLRTDDINIPVPENGLDLAVSYQVNDNGWHVKFINPTDEIIGMWIIYSCLG